MKGQLSIFESDVPSASGDATEWSLYVDGASRGNPGLSGAGVYLLKDAHPMVKQGFFLGKGTNNQAEYAALILGICAFHRHKQEAMLKIFSDSELLVRQLTGFYTVKNSNLKFLHQQALLQLQGLKYRIAHVRRSDNQIADRLANEGIDKRIPVPQELQPFCLSPFEAE